MSENTPTPTELIAEAERYVKSNPDSDVVGVLASALHAALAQSVTAASSRDALAATLAEALALVHSVPGYVLDQIEREASA